MAADKSRTEDEWPPDPAPPHSRKARIFWFAVEALVIVVILIAGWYGYSLRQAARAARDEANMAGNLSNKIGIDNQSLTEEEFEKALALCDAAHPETRFTALIAATADAMRYHPERKPRVVPVAARMVGDREASVRQKAIGALRGLRAREHIGLIRPSLQAADPRERKAAEEAIAVLEAADASK